MNNQNLLANKNFSWFQLCYKEEATRGQQCTEGGLTEAPLSSCIHMKISLNKQSHSVNRIENKTNLLAVLKAKQGTNEEKLSFQICLESFITHMLGR